MALPANMPVLVGVGQVMRRWGAADPGAAPSPDGLRADAARAALEDAGDGLAGAVDQVVVVRTMLDSIASAAQPFGRCANPPGALAQDLGLGAVRAIYSAVGGDQPQALVNEAAEAIFAGDARAVLIAGAEATGAMKAALRRGTTLDWARNSGDAAFDDRAGGAPLLSPYELANGLGPPSQTYPVFEHALRARLGLSREAHVALMSELWATLAAVAAGNPHAQFRTARTQEFLATPGRDNYPISDPYLKWHVAQDAVNQGAAAVLTSVGVADAIGLDLAKRVYLHGYAALADATPAARPDLSRSRAIEGVLAGALAAAGKLTADIAHFDLYSCFPCAVLLAVEALGLDWRDKAATVTGGLPFFGGPGNTYSLHAIATMAERLRAEPQAFGLVLANGGFLSKVAAGVYSAQAPSAWSPVSSAAIQQAIDAEPGPPLLSRTADAVIESFTVTYARDRPTRGCVVARTADGGRILARGRPGHRATLAALAGGEPLGRSVRITHEGGVNLIDPAEPLGSPGRRFAHVAVERRGPLLEVTLNRPDAMNALHSAAHFELHEIWDDFGRDPDLWVAIVTGAGDRAFSAGNDLKVTATGGDMTMPPSGFGGLCSRFDRTKPVIAAVNGVAMGGGLEIALACDMIVIDERARVALPEVRVGLFAGAGGLQRLTRQIGRKAATELILTGRHVAADEALALGIVNRVVPAGTALDAARALAGEVLQNSPSAVQASKAALNTLEEIEALREAMARNGPLFAKLMQTRDFREGIAAFAEKRPPNWTGA